VPKRSLPHQHVRKVEPTGLGGILPQVSTASKRILQPVAAQSSGRGILQPPAVKSPKDKTQQPLTGKFTVATILQPLAGESASSVPGSPTPFLADRPKIYSLLMEREEGRG